MFPRPTSFYNERCCVDEYKLLKTPRAELDEIDLALPVDHYGSCFGSFEEISYFVPRVVELLTATENGFAHGMLNLSFNRLLRDSERKYRDMGLWDTIEACMNAIFTDFTGKFTLHHYDKPACELKGWGKQYKDIASCTGGIDDFIVGFYQPVLSARACSDGTTVWDRFFHAWALDENPYSAANLLDIIRRHFDEGMFDYALPDSFVARLSERAYALALVQRAAPAFASIESPTWLTDVLDCLGIAPELLVTVQG